MAKLEAGSLWQHKKHDPEFSRYHQYRFMLETRGATGPQGDGVSKNTKKIFPARHTETERLLWICCFQDKAWAYCPGTGQWLDESLVVYRSLLADELPWARPKGDFLDGRFTPIQPEQVDEPTIEVELFD